MKSKKLLFSLLTVLILICTSCQKDDYGSGDNEPQENIPDVFSEYFGSEISRDFLGTVIDINNNPIEGVTITIDDETATTDSNGVFIIRDASVNERFGYIKAEKQGYIHGSRAVVPTDGTNKVTIMLIEANTTESISSGSVSTVTANDGSSVSFDGSFIKEDGSEYTGSVDVILHHLDPADEDMPLQMPGMLYAQNEAGAERMLQTMGMLAVELRGEAGEDLNLPEGSTSEIRIPLDPSLMGIAPSTIPLWYFDEVNGYWKEEGEATLQGNIYVGTVSHFSFWNCDIPAEAVTLCVNAINSNEEPLNNLSVSITSATFGTTYGYTNENGEVCGYVPINETLELNIYSYNNCSDTPLYTETIGPFTADSSVLAIVSDNTDVVSKTVIGTFTNCDGNPVTEGYILLNYNNIETITEVTDGNFEITVLSCSEYNQFSLEGIDLGNLQTSEEVIYEFITPNTNVGQIISCNNLYYNYVTYQYNDTTIVRSELDGAPGFWFRCEISETGNTLIATVDPNTTGPSSIWLTLWDNTNGVVPGQFNGDNSEGNTGPTFANLSGYHTFSQIGPAYFRNFNGTAQLIRMGDIGEIVEISFSGNFDISDSPNNTVYIEENVPINGHMYLIRTE